MQGVVRAGASGRNCKWVSSLVRCKRHATGNLSAAACVWLRVCTACMPTYGDPYVTGLHFMDGHGQLLSLCAAVGHAGGLGKCAGPTSQDCVCCWCNTKVHGLRALQHPLFLLRYVPVLMSSSWTGHVRHSLIRYSCSCPRGCDRRAKGAIRTYGRNIKMRLLGGRRRGLRQASTCIQTTFHRDSSMSWTITVRRRC